MKSSDMTGLIQHFRAGSGPYRGVFVVLGYDSGRDSLLAGLQDEGEWVAVGTFGQGLKPEEKATLVQTILANREQEGAAGSIGAENHHIEHSVRPGVSEVGSGGHGSGASSFVRIKPGICVELDFDSISIEGSAGKGSHAAGVMLVRPMFRSFRLGEKADSCTWNRLVVDNANIHPKARLTHPDKLLWKSIELNKETYAAYLVRIAPRMLPFLQDRILTSIRYPHGVPGESFYQKNSPSYAPDFVHTVQSEDINYIVCNDLSTLVWLGNQAAVELHVPFQRVGKANPLEIVLDLDPPSRNEFSYAVRAALEIRDVLDSFGIIGYPKLSGGKGLQIHIPLGLFSLLTYDDTRVFTSFVAEYLVQKYPAMFTVERLKKNRGGRLYVDYIQHAYGKTIICPYSARGSSEATVAAPLEWEEVSERLAPEQYTIPSVLERLHERPCPMRNYFVQSNAVLGTVIEQLRARQPVRV